MGRRAGLEIYGFFLFKQAYYLVKNPEHLTAVGLLKIVVIKISLDGGLPEDLASAFPAVVPAAKAQIEGLSSIFDSLFWLAGFASAEGSLLFQSLNLKRS